MADRTACADCRRPVVLLKLKDAGCQWAQSNCPPGICGNALISWVGSIGWTLQRCATLRGDVSKTCMTRTALTGPHVPPRAPRIIPLALRCSTQPYTPTPTVVGAFHQ